MDWNIDILIPNHDVEISKALRNTYGPQLTDDLPPADPRGLASCFPPPSSLSYFLRGL
jgi:hypothetical protein